MNKKLILTSFVALGFACPAMAEPSHNGSFPNDGYMLEDYTYTNAATSTNMDGVYEGTVNANAEYENILYQLAAGKYLPANSETPIDCNQNGYYCPGDQNGVYYSSSAQGLSQCPNGYTNSGTGASANTDCYRACSTSDVANSLTVSGGYYYGDNNQCEPTACVNGWHKKAGSNGTQIRSDLMVLENVSTTVSGVSYTGDAMYNASNYGISSSDLNVFIADIKGVGLVHGHGRCSTAEATNNDWTFTNPTIFDTLTDETGQTGAKYCYCQIDGYTPAGGTLQTVSSSWVFYTDFGDEEECGGSCYYNCADNLATEHAFRTILLGTITTTLASCEANTITINWSDVDEATAGQNNEGTATYGGNINTPFKAATKPGQRFKGWRFSKPSNN